jgi:hypothetical protein
MGGTAYDMLEMKRNKIRDNISINENTKLKRLIMLTEKEEENFVEMSSQVINEADENVIVEKQDDEKIGKKYVS